MSHLVPLGAIWYLLEPLGNSNYPLEPLGTVCEILKQFGSSWSPLVPLGTKLV